MGPQKNYIFKLATIKDIRFQTTLGGNLRSVRRSEEQSNQTTKQDNP
jgi:hypothetical protein